MAHPEGYILEANGLTIGYGKGKEQHAVAKDITLGLRKGELHCLLGPNGVGKSTLMKTVMGFIPPLSGELRLEGKPFSAFKTDDLARKISVVLTDRLPPGNLTVGQLVSLGRIPHTGWLGNLTAKDRDSIHYALDQTGIEGIQQARISELSDGQLQKTLIARAVAQDGEIMILDEPTAHLDLANRFEVMTLLRKLATTGKKSILVVTHDLEIALETADKFWLMGWGRPLFGGTPEDLALQGSLDVLVPREKYTFNIQTGKIEPKTHFEYPEISGSEDLAKWVRLALRKNNIEIGGLEIYLDDSSSRIQVRHGEKIKDCSTIAEMIAFIKEISLD